MTLRIKGATTIKGLTSVNWSPNLLFAAGEQGVWYDPSDFSTMFQDSAAANAVSAVGQSVAVIYDKRYPVGSTSFNGSGSKLSTPTSSALQFGTGAFTIEFWFNTTASTLYSSFISNELYSTGFTILINMSPGNGYVRVYNGSAGSILASDFAWNDGNWHHLAYVRDSSSARLYIDGALKDTNAGQATFNMDAGSNWIFGNNDAFAGRGYVGYLSNFRVVKGAALYTANFTPPTGPLTPVNGTSLLTCGVAWTGNPTITLNGTPTVSALNPFSATTGNNATQSTAANRPTLQIDGNGKYYLSFDGTNDWLSTSSINMTATDDVTVWAGIRKNANTNGMVCEFGTGAGGNTGGFALIAPSLAGDDFYWRTYGTSIVNINYVAASPVTAVINASAKISTPVSTLRFNGTQVATSTSSQGTGNYNNYVLYVGTRDGTQIYLNGRIYGLIIRGAASTASQISMTETYMNSKTAAY